MGEDTTRARAHKIAAPRDAMKDARSVLTRSVMQPLMKAIGPLAAAVEAAKDPDQIRHIARHRGEQLEERAKQRGQELVEAARLQAKRLRADAARQRRELEAQAEADVQSVLERVETAYQDTLKAGWTPDLLQEVGYEPPPPRPRRQAHRRRRAAINGASVATPDTGEPAEPTELPANVPA